MHEKRLTTRLIDYWERIRGGATAYPLFQQFNPGAVDDIWQNCLALQTQPNQGGTQQYIYVHCGETVQQAIGQDVRGQVLSTNMKFFPGAKIIKRIDEVVNLSTPSPLLDDGQFVNTNGKVIKYRACLLAFGGENSVSHVIIGVSWRAF